MFSKNNFRFKKLNKKNACAIKSDLNCVAWKIVPERKAKATVKKNEHFLSPDILLKITFAIRQKKARQITE